MQKKISFFVLDTLSAVLLGLGIAILLLPFALYLGLHADNDSYIEIVKWGGGKTWALAQLHMVQMLRWEWFILPIVLIIVGYALRRLPGYSFPPGLRSQVSGDSVSQAEH